MAKIVDHGRLRETLLLSTINVVADYGMDGFSSKRVSEYSKLNESYIFRYFVNLEDIKYKSFEMVLKDFTVVLNNSDENLSELKNYFINNPNIVLFFQRYFHSFEGQNKCPQAFDRFLGEYKNQIKSIILEAEKAYIDILEKRINS